VLSLLESLQCSDASSSSWWAEGKLIIHIVQHTLAGTSLD
jgi:hypothetical protein